MIGDLKDLPGIKERELRELGTCAVCGQQLLQGPNAHPLFYRVTVETCGVLMDAIRRQDGLGHFFGNGAIAMAMGADEDLAKIISVSKKRLVHAGCANEAAIVQAVRCDEGAAP